MTRKTNKNTIHVQIWSTQIIMKSYWIVCILNNWVNDSKVSLWTWSEHLNATPSTVGSSQLDSDGWRVSRHTSGRAPEAKPWTNERPDIFARASWARRGTQRGSDACARFPTVNRCLCVMRCPRPSCAGKRWPTSAAFFAFLTQVCGIAPAAYAVRRWLCSRRAKIWQTVLCVCVCGACDTDKRPRRVRVTRMLPGKEDTREKTHFIVSCFPRTPVLSPRDTKLSCRWRCEAFASCWTANTPTEGWTTTLELCPFDWITWRLLFKTCGQNPHLGFLLSIFVVRLMWVWGIERLRELHFRRGRAGQQWGLLLDCLPLCPIHRPCGGAVTSTEDK